MRDLNDLRKFIIGITGLPTSEACAIADGIFRHPDFKDMQRQDERANELQDILDRHIQDLTIGMRDSILGQLFKLSVGKESFKECFDRILSDAKKYHELFPIAAEWKESADAVEIGILGYLESLKAKHTKQMLEWKENSEKYLSLKKQGTPERWEELIEKEAQLDTITSDFEMVEICKTMVCKVDSMLCEHGLRPCIQDEQGNETGEIVRDPTSEEIKTFTKMAYLELWDGKDIIIDAQRSLRMKENKS